MTGIQAFNIFSGVYAVPTLLLVKLCELISTSLFKCAFHLMPAAVMVYFTVNLQVEDYKPTNHYILDLRPEYGNDIIEITHDIFQSFTYHLQFFRRPKRRGQKRKVVKKSGWRLHFVRPKKKTRRKATHNLEQRSADVVNGSDTELSEYSSSHQPERQDYYFYSSSDYSTSAHTSQEMLIQDPPLPDTDDVDDFMYIKLKGQSKYLASLPDGRVIPSALLS